MHVIEMDEKKVAGAARSAAVPNGDAAAPPKRYRIGELADHTGVTRQTLHNYTQWGLIEPVGQTRGGHRLYAESVFARLMAIRRLKRGRTMEQVRTLLSAVPGFARQADARAERMIEQGSASADPTPAT